MDATIDMSMTDGQFREIAALVQSRFGIQLPAEKRGLVTSRLQRLVRASGLGSFDEYWRRHMRPPSREVLSDLVDRLSTNHTYLWREPEHFEYLAREVLPRVRESERARDLRLWCAAAATGEEPYCIQMVVRETLGAEYDRWTAGLLATDISDGALSRAREGMYSQQARCGTATCGERPGIAGPWWTPSSATCCSAG